MDDYDVFLNHRGPDVKAGFMAHLEQALRQAGLNPFLDKKSLEKGDDAFKGIDDALEVARVHVAVVSKRYAESKYCLSELAVMMRSGKPVIPVLYDVEPSELRRVDKGLFAVAFEKHKSREPAERVQEWAEALGKLADITVFLFRSTDYRGDEVDLKQEVVDAVLRVIPRDESLQVERHLVGVEEHLNVCVNQLEKISGAPSILCLVGMGGIGKTTLAKELYNKFLEEKKFQAMSLLEIDRDSPSRMEVGPSVLQKLQKKLLWDLMRVPENNPQSYKSWFQKLGRQGPVLIVIDDIYQKIQFETLILDTNLDPGSCIIITSRDRHLLNTIVGGSSNYYIHEVTPLGRDDSLKLFNRHAFRNEEAPENFKILANDVSKACGGLPLALKVVGSSLSDKKSDEDQECIWPEAIDALKGDPDITKALKWSYNCLSVTQKLMFVDIACVFYGWGKPNALEIWKSCKKCSSCCGSGTPHTSLRHLMDRCLVKLEYVMGQWVLSMHGLLRDMGESIGNVDGSHLWEVKAITVVEGTSQRLNQVRALNLANSQEKEFDVEDIAKMVNLHFLTLDGCNISGDLGHISKELRWIRWRYMPLSHLPLMLNMSNLVSLDLSKSTNLGDAWTDSEPALEGCPNLLKLNLSECTSITTLPNSLGRLSRLQKLDLNNCTNLHRLPNSIGQLSMLESLSLYGCRSLEALPDTISALSKLSGLYMWACSPSMSKLPLMTGITGLTLDLVNEEQAVGMGNVHALKVLGLMEQTTDEAMTALDSLGILPNLSKLFCVQFMGCTLLTKIPETMGQLTRLDILELLDCENLQQLPTSICQLKLLWRLRLVKCNNMKTLPDSLGELKNLQYLWIYKCKLFTELPESIGQLPRLRELRIEGSNNLQSLPESMRQLSTLCMLEVFDCGTLEGLGALRMLRGFRLWGCTSVTELPGSCLRVLDGHYWDPTWFYDLEGFSPIRPRLNDLGLVEQTPCGALRLVQEDAGSRRTILQRVQNLRCSNPMVATPPYFWPTYYWSIGS